MSFNLVIVKQGPYSGRASHEILEAIMSLALFEVEHKVVFFEAGLTWLLKNQQTTVQKSLEKQLNALPIYGCDEVFYCAEHQDELVGKAALNSIADPINLDQLSNWLREAEKVEVF